MKPAFDDVQDMHKEMASNLAEIGSEVATYSTAEWFELMHTLAKTIDIYAAMLLLAIEQRNEALSQLSQEDAKQVMEGIIDAMG